MTIDKDPPRLFDSHSPDDSLLRDALRQARSDVSPDDAIARMLAHFPPDPGAGGGPSGPGPGVGKGIVGAGKGAVGTSTLIGALAGAVVSFGLWATGVDLPSPSGANVAVSAASPRSSANPLDPGANRGDGPAEKPPSDSPSPARQKAASDPSSGRTAPLAGAASPTDSPSPVDPAATSSAGSAGSGAPTEIADESEGAFLARAQALLGGDPSGALALAEQHRSRYPKGSLGQEREVIAITALMGMGRAADARARAEALLAANPSSAHRRRLSVLVPGISAE